MLHNMMVVEWIHKCDDSIEDAAFYDIVVDNEVGETVPNTNDAIDQAAEFVLMQEENISRQLLEVEYLEMLGIRVHDTSLRDDMEWVSILLQLMCMAQFQRNALYDMADHHRLRNAIINNELERKHKAAKGIN
jgi:hypothetical protein